MRRPFRRLLLLTALGLAFAAGCLWSALNQRWVTWTDGVGISRHVGETELRHVLWETPATLLLGFDDINHIEPAVSGDGRILVFARGKAGYNSDLFWCRREGDRWSEPQPLTTVNTPADELGPALNHAGDVLWFYSDRPGGMGGFDIWMSRFRYDDWETPVVLDENVNSIHDEYDPALDAGGIRLAFASNRPRDAAMVAAGDAWKATLRERVGRRSFDLYSALRVDAPAENRYVFSAAEPWDELNSSADDGQPAFSPHGDFVYFSSNREGGPGGFDLYRLRLTPSDPNGPQLLPAPVNTDADEMDPTLWHEGHGLVFSSNHGQVHPLNFTLRTTNTREVIAIPWLTWGSAEAWLRARGLWLLLLVAAALGCVWLWRLLRSPGSLMGPRARALAFSGLVHALALFLLSVWFLRDVLLPQTEGDLDLAVSEQNLAREKLALELREDVAELSVPETISPQEQMQLPQDISPPDMPEALRMEIPEPSSSAAFELPEPPRPDAAESAALPETPAPSPELTEWVPELPPIAFSDFAELARLTEVPRPRASTVPEAVPAPPSPPAERARAESRADVSLPAALATTAAPALPKIDIPFPGLRAATLKRGDSAMLPELPPVATPGDIPASLPVFEASPTLQLETAPVASLSYHLRDPERRQNLLEQLGGNDETEAAIGRALEFFVKAQEDDGRWNIRRWGGEEGHDLAATGLAMLCFMGHGATHQADTPYKPTLMRAMAWLLARQEADGRLRGKDMYDHCIATIALAEAYAMSHDPELRGPLQRAVDFLVRAQHAETGGWRYQPNESGDTSVFGWALMALSSARQSGLTVPEEIFRKSEVWLDRVSAGRKGGLYGYENRTADRRAMIAEGMFSRQLLNTDRDKENMRESAAYLSTGLPQARDVDYYYWYYGCLSLYQHQGEVWDAWNTRMRRILVDGQERNGEWIGSWKPEGQYSDRMGRSVSTAMATLSLEVYYRYLPMYSGNYKKP